MRTFNNKKLALAISLAISISSLTACGGGGSATVAEVAADTLTGVAFKGPIDGAIVQVFDQDGNLLSSGTSSDGKFVLSKFDIPNSVETITIITTGGSYVDEATGETVSPALTLKTIFTKAEIESIINAEQVMALTPESTIYSHLTTSILNADSTKTPAVAMAEAKTIINREIIGNTNPTAGAVDGDEILLLGDFTSATPANTAEAFARNRAISFSYEAKNLNLSPAQVDNLVIARSTDLEDGTLDGKTLDNSIIEVTDKDNNTIDLSTVDQTANVGRARSELFANTIERLSNGELSQEERDELALLGVDTDIFETRNNQNSQAASVTAALLTSNSLPDFQRLPLMTDEDPGSGVTYTLNATANVAVTVNGHGEISIDDTDVVTVANTGTSWVTPMSRYNSEQLPVMIKALNGDVMTLNLNNNLAEDSTIHWHGFEIPASEDGGPDIPVAANSSKSYSFTLQQDAAPLWFHPHPDMETGKQVYQGLAGVFIIDDAISQQLKTSNALPSGEYDIPLMVQDRRFANDDDGDGIRELLYKDSRMDIIGMYGDKILVNGSILPKLAVEARQYRFRLFNTSNARTYDFALSNDAAFKIVGTDGGLIDIPVTATSIRLGVAERAEIIVDFSNTTDFPLGESVMLISKAFSISPIAAIANINGTFTPSETGIGSGFAPGSNFGPGSGFGGATSQDTSSGMRSMNGLRLDIMRFDVAATTTTDPVTLYTALPDAAPVKTRLVESDAVNTRQFVLSMSMSQDSESSETPSIDFKINGKLFDINRVDETIYLNNQSKIEIWEITNASPMAHPYHAHAIQWQLLDRNGDAAQGSDLGPQDTVLVQPGETVRFIGEFDPTVNDGKYMYHCHILEHEDAGMMGFFEIKATEADPS